MTATRRENHRKTGRQNEEERRLFLIVDTMNRHWWDFLTDMVRNNMRFKYKQQDMRLFAKYPMFGTKHERMSKISSACVVQIWLADAKRTWQKFGSLHRETTDPACRQLITLFRRIGCFFWLLSPPWGSPLSEDSAGGASCMNGFGTRRTLRLLAAAIRLRDGF